MGPTVFGWLSGMLEIILPQLKAKTPSIHVVDIVLHVEGSGEGMSCTRTGLAVSGVENRNDTQQGKGAARADGGTLVLRAGIGAGREEVAGKVPTWAEG